MKFDTEGTYTLQYTAVDECGNETVEDREVIVGSLRTVLYNDGTFIINELPEDNLKNRLAHGGDAYVYAPFKRDGNTDEEKYIFSSSGACPWKSNKSGAIKKVKIGSPIKPFSMRFWFSDAKSCTEIDLTNIDSSEVNNMAYLFGNCDSLKKVKIDSLDTSMVTSFNSMFYHCVVLESIDLSPLRTSAVTDMGDMFSYCYKLKEVNLNGFDTASVTDMHNMFAVCRALEVLDLSSFNTISVDNSREMFNNCSTLKQIFASTSFDLTNATNSAAMFTSMSTNLVGGAGTTWSTGNPMDKTYAHIDGGTANPGYFTLKQA